MAGRMPPQPLAYQLERKLASVTQADLARLVDATNEPRGNALYEYCLLP
jgi:hypothetical protein